ncbi:STAS domain-containing protein [Streptomyces sp. NPDC001351]|uniref:STAS domain-containing protein n=1 Tax=Streptomyces sp. NPDC001351 TaxID=3364564 RepID=UPI0036C760D8
MSKRQWPAMVSVARVDGAMDYLTQPWLRERLHGVIADAGRFVILELTEVSFCDSAGLNVLLWARNATEAHNVVLVLACVPSSLRRY